MEDVDDAKGKLLANGASVVRDINDIPTGRMIYRNYADGSVVELVQWAPELVEQHIFPPLHAGTAATRI